MEWAEIYGNSEKFKEVLSYTHLPYREWLYNDICMRKKLMDDLCKYWDVYKDIIENSVGTLDHPKTLYIYNK